MWIPQELIDNPELDWVNKILLAEIQSLDKLPKGCFISNNAISIFLGINRSSVIRRLNFLVDNGYITTKNKYENKRCIGRIIIPTNKVVVAQKTISSSTGDHSGRNGDNGGRKKNTLVVATATEVVAKQDPIRTEISSVMKSVMNPLTNSVTNTESLSSFGVAFTEKELEEEKKYRNIK